MLRSRLCGIRLGRASGCPKRRSCSSGCGSAPVLSPRRACGRVRGMDHVLNQDSLMAALISSLASNYVMPVVTALLFVVVLAVPTRAGAQAQAQEAPQIDP